MDVSAEVALDLGAPDQPLDIATTTDGRTVVLDAAFVDVAVADSAPGIPVCTPQQWYLDLDKDGFGDNGAMVSACQAPAGYVAKGATATTSIPCATLGQRTILDSRPIAAARAAPSIS
jgi:hypothetical protein